MVKMINRHWQQVAHHKSMIYSFVVLYVVIALITLIPAFLQRKIFDFAIPNQDIETLIIILGSVIIVNVAVFAFNLISNFMLSKFSEDNQYQSRKVMYKKILTLPYLRQSRMSLGEVNKILEDNDKLSRIPRVYLSEIVRNVIVIIINYPILFLLSYKLTLIRLSTVPLEVMIGNYFRKKDQVIEKQLLPRQERLMALLADLHYGSATMKSLQAESEIYRKIRIAHLEIKDIQLKKQHLNSVWKGVTTFTTSALGSLVFFIAALDIINGSFSFGSFIAFNIISAQGTQALTGLINTYKNTAVLQNSQGRFETVDSIQSENSLYLSKGEMERINGDIVFRNVRYSYGEGGYALDDVSFQIDRGNHVAIVGPSGAGKTTIMNLLLGYLELNEGSLLIGGRPIGEYDVNQLRQSMAVVLQETFLFQASIRENLTIGTSVKNENEIWEALTRANAADFVRRLPGKLEYICGGSSKLSGGERHEIDYSQAFLAQSVDCYPR